MSGTPAHEVVVINQYARALQEEIAQTARVNQNLDAIEDKCFEIHRSVCTILSWIEQEREQP
jgi:hypothetical protein